MGNRLKKYAVALAAMPILAGAFVATSYAAAGTAPQRTGAAAATTLKVMDWNIHGEGADIAGIANLIKAHGVDVVTVQEIHRRPELDQVKQLADRLGWELGTNVHFGPPTTPARATTSGRGRPATPSSRRSGSPNG